MELAIATHVPLAKPSPYTKRWWTPSLTDLRKQYTLLRNRFYWSRNHNAPSCITKKLEKQAWAAKHQYFKELRRQKKQHWEDFLDDADNILPTAKYLPDHTLRSSFSPIARVKTGPTTVTTTNAEIGEALLKNFFPPPLPYPPPVQPEADSLVQIITPPIQKEDVRAAIFRAPPLKAPGPDNIPALVWQKLWPVLHEPIFSLFHESLRQGKLPEK